MDSVRSIDLGSMYDLRPSETGLYVEPDLLILREEFDYHGPLVGSQQIINIPQYQDWQERADGLIEPLMRSQLPKVLLPDENGEVPTHKVHPWNLYNLTPEQIALLDPQMMYEMPMHATGAKVHSNRFMDKRIVTPFDHVRPTPEEAQKMRAKTRYLLIEAIGLEEGAIWYPGWISFNTQIDTSSESNRRQVATISSNIKLAQVTSAGVKLPYVCMMARPNAVLLFGLNEQGLEIPVRGVAIHDGNYFPKVGLQRGGFVYVPRR